MKWALLFGLLLVAVAAEELSLAEQCDEEAVCNLPECRCSSTNIPGDLLPRDTPQFVTVTFRDALNIGSIETYRSILYDRVNSNGCPAGTTFFINHEYNNYQLVNELYNRGFEIGLNSISHRTPQTFWADASYDDLKLDIADQRAQMSHFANIPYDSIQGVRLPFFQMSGNTSFQILADYGLTYDNTWSTISFTNPGLWPYTLDYASTQDCVNGPCPSASIAGPWVLPIVTWTDLNGIPCSMLDACFFIPDVDDEEGWYRFILTNFEKHYLNNRAPFAFHVNEWYISSNPAVRRAVIRFLDLVNNLNDAFMVNSAEVIEWVKNPVPLNEYVQKPCRTWVETNCPAASCGPLTAEHNQFNYWIQICNVCPAVYPWIGNPLGQALETTTIDAADV